MMPCFLCPERLLVPQRVPVRGKGKMRFQDAFCGAYFTFAITREGHIYGFGLSNYHQLGEICLCPCESPAFTGAPKCPELTLHTQCPLQAMWELEIALGALGLIPSPFSCWM